MKLKTSYFNKTIFKKNVNMYWPLWTIYTFILMCMLPIKSYFTLLCYDEEGADIVGNSRIDSFSKYFFENMGFQDIYYIILIMAIVTGVALLSYLYSTKSAYMIHSLPVTRIELFFTNVICGLCFILVPIIICFFSVVLICVSFGMVEISMVGLCFLSYITLGILEYSIAICCGMITGQLLAMLGYYAICNLMAKFIWAVGMCMISKIPYGESCYGNSSLSNISEEGLLIFSPIDEFIKHSMFIYDFDTKTSFAINYIYFVFIIVYLIVSIVLYAVACHLYKKRNIESAGDFLTIRFLKPVYRWGSGVCVATIVSYLSEGILGKAWVSISFKAEVVEFAIFVFIGAMIGEMFIRKKFKVFSRKIIIEEVVFSIFTAAVLFGMHIHAINYMMNIPDLDEVEYVGMSYEYEFKSYDKAGMDKIVEMHKYLIDHIDTEKTVSDDSERIMIKYGLKNGDVEERWYYINCKDDNLEFINEIRQLECDKDNFSKYLFGEDYENNINILAGDIEIQDPNAKQDEYETMNIDLEIEDAGRLYEAIQKDIDEGTLQTEKMDNDYLSDDETENYEIEEGDEKEAEKYVLSLDVKCKEPALLGTEFYGIDEEKNIYRLETDYSANCKNIMELVKEFAEKKTNSKSK